MENNKYNYGLSLLKIISMLMICILHILGQGGILENTTFLSNQYKISWFLEIFSYCAINCFALISGYNNLNTKNNYKKFLNLWISVLFYNILITFLFSLYFKQNLFSIKLVFPILTDQYWYLTGYFVVFLFMPLLNAGIKNTNKIQLRNTLIILIALISTSSLGYTDSFLINNGYSPLWLIILYLLGGYIKEYNPFEKYNKYIFFGIYILSNLFVFLSKICIETFFHNKGETNDVNILINYISLPIIIASITLFLFFKNLELKDIKIIKLLSKHAFFCYIIHCNPIIWDLLKNSFVFCVNMSAYKIVLIAIFSAITIFLFCIIIDVIKNKIIKLFNNFPIFIIK